MPKHDIEKIASVIYWSLEDAIHRLKTHKVPEEHVCIDAIKGCLNTRTASWRKTAPPNREDNWAARCLWHCLKFHSSGGSLWGYPWQYQWDDRELFDQIDTLAIVLKGGKSQAADAWAKALGK